MIGNIEALRKTQGMPVYMVIFLNEIEYAEPEYWTADELSDAHKALSQAQRCLSRLPERLWEKCLSILSQTVDKASPFLWFQAAHFLLTGFE